MARSASLPGELPLIGRLGYGEMRIREGSNLYRYYVDGGFVEVSRQHGLHLSRNGQSRLKQLDRGGGRGDTCRKHSKKPANTPETMAIRDRADGPGSVGSGGYARSGTVKSFESAIAAGTTGTFGCSSRTQSDSISDPS